MTQFAVSSQARHRGGKFSDRAADRRGMRSAEAEVIFRRAKEYTAPRASRNRAQARVTAKTSTVYDADTCPGEYVDAGFQNKSTQHQLGAFAFMSDDDAIGFHTGYCARSVDFILLSVIMQFAVSGQIMLSETEGCCGGLADDCAAVKEYCKAVGKRLI